MRNKFRKNAEGLLFLLPSLAGVLVLVLVPFGDVIRRSFMTAVTEQPNGIENYKLVFQNEAFALAVKNTLRFTAVCLPLLIITGLLLAVLLSKIKHVTMLKSCFLFPMAIPAATVVLLWKVLFLDDMDSDASFYVLVFSYLWKNTGYTVILWLAGILSIPAELTEAARVDGAGEVRCFCSVVFPNLKGTLYTITVLSFLNSFKVFREAYLVAGAYPQERIYLLQHLFNNWFTNLEFDKMAAAAVVIAAVLFLAILLLQRLWDNEHERI